ncbi:TonB-dependent receptor [Methylibium sp.]|uniref:TonB-dependent receptor n=1 Tax=Methylibium sp. TaxID=2067992 RepID=UPI002DB736BB|nr:TonB-dependent receptor [Methylibium sp.]
MRSSCAALLGTAACAFAQTPPAPEAAVIAQTLPAVQVTGSRDDKLDLSPRSEALPAPVQVLDAERIERLNLRSYSDLYRAIPGVQSVNFGQGDIGSPFVMRGFGNGSHGIATGFFIDGVPQNIPSGGIGGHGTSEYNWLTPEMIERVEVVKGPFSALYGDQALAGVVNIVTRRCAPASSVSLEAGRYGLGRVAGVHCRQPGEPDGVQTFAAGEAYHSDGWRDRSRYDRYSLLAKATLPLGASLVSLRANAYRADYDVPGYLDFDAVKAGRVDPRSTPYRSDGGDNARYGLVASWQPRTGDAGWSGTAYVDAFDRVRYSSFNAAMPMLQTEQFDKRTVFGGRLHYHAPLGERVAVTLGVDTRQDRGDIGNFATVARSRTGAVNSDYGLAIASYGAFVQAQWKPIDALKLVGGWRLDSFHQAIDNRRRPERSGSGSQHLGSPRFGAAYEVSKALTVYANAGEGFRSLGAAELSPSGAVGAANFDFAIPTGTTRDLGLNAKLGPVRVNANVYRTEIRSELRQDPPGSGLLVNIGDSRRDGFELDARWSVNESLVVYGSWAHVKARVANPLVAGQTKLANVAPDLYGAGLESAMPYRGGRLLFDLSYLHSAPEPYYVGTSERETDPWELVNARLSFEQGRSAYTGYLIWQPREFGSDQAGTSFNPKPRLEFGAVFKYSFL